MLYFLVNYFIQAAKLQKKIRLRKFYATFITKKALVNIFLKISLEKVTKIGKFIIPLHQIAIFFKMKRLFLMMALSTTLMTVAAQQPEEEMTETTDSMATVNSYVDSLLAFRHKQMSATQTVTSPDGRLYRLFAPLTFYRSPAARQLSMEADGGNGGYSESNVVAKAVDEALLAVYLNRPDLVVSTQTNLDKVGSVREEFEKPVKNNIDMSKAVEPVPDADMGTPQGLIIQKPNFWTLKGESNLQLMQNFVSDNWYKGGESNYSMLGQVVLSANYNNKSGVQFDNILEMKLGFQTSPSDTVHKFKSNNDLIRYTGRFGLQAIKNWNYTLQVLAYTQFTRGYKSNDTRVYSDFMSPFNLNIGLGMTYNVKALKGKLTGKVNISPFSYNWKYVDRKDLVGHYGIPGDHHSMDDYGSQITSELQWVFSNQVKWKTRFYYYTTYKRTEMEWENTINLSISKYVTTNIFIYPRFDDSVKRDSDLGYWQFKEYCSLGVTYSF